MRFGINVALNVIGFATVHKFLLALLPALGPSSKFIRSEDKVLRMTVRKFCVRDSSGYPAATEACAKVGRSMSG